VFYKFVTPTFATREAVSSINRRYTVGEERRMTPSALWLVHAEKWS